MPILNPDSLAVTLGNLEGARWSHTTVSAAEARRLSAWITSRQGQPRSYRGLFAPTDTDFESARTPTGERLTSGAGTAHILGQEAARSLRRLGARTVAARRALECADAAVDHFVHNTHAGQHRSMPTSAEYCCARCTVALWRNLTAGGAARIEPERWLRAGLRHLRTHRQDDGRWRRFPFHYTMLALLDIDLAAATAELRHAAPVCERLVRRAPSDPVGRCRQRIAEAVLERI